MENNTNKYKFDPKTGTLRPINEIEAEIKAEETQQKFSPISMIKALEAQKPKVIPTKGILDDKDEPTKTFKALSDLRTFQIIDKSNNNIMAVISGYELDINFNLAILDNTEKVEQLVNGISQVFREILMEKLLGNQ